MSVPCNFFKDGLQYWGPLMSSRHAHWPDLNMLQGLGAVSHAKGKDVYLLLTCIQLLSEASCPPVEGCNCNHGF